MTTSLAVRNQTAVADQRPARALRRRELEAAQLEQLTKLTQVIIENPVIELTGGVFLISKLADMSAKSVARSSFWQSMSETMIGSSLTYGLISIIMCQQISKNPALVTAGGEAIAGILGAVGGIAASAATKGKV